LVEFSLGYVGGTVRKIFFVSDFILQTAYTVGTYALTSTLPSLSLIDMIYSTAVTEATPASVQGVGVDFMFIWISLLHDVLKRIRNSTARCRCVFGSIDGYGD
jgi:hypothetical protein